MTSKLVEDIQFFLKHYFVCPDSADGAVEYRRPGVFTGRETAIRITIGGGKDKINLNVLKYPCCFAKKF